MFPSFTDERTEAWKEEELWLQAMAEMLSGPKAKLLEVNKKAFALGRAAALA